MMTMAMDVVVMTRQRCRRISSPVAMSPSLDVQLSKLTSMGTASRMMIRHSGTTSALFSSSLQDNIVKFRIVSINDVYDLSNLPKLQTYLTQLPSNEKPQAVVLCGDFLSPSTLSSIDGGRGMVSTLRTVGITHVSFGNHEQDLKLATLHQRIIELSKSIEVLNSNVLPPSVPPPAADATAEVSAVSQNNDNKNNTNDNEWMRSLTHRYSLVSSSCGRVTVALIGLLSDEPGLFRDNTFKSIPIHDVLETYTTLYNKLISRKRSSKVADEGDDQVADLILPMTHQSMNRDKELAQHILEVVQQDCDGDSSSQDGLGNVGYVMLGGHEHEPYNEIVTSTSETPRSSEEATDTRPFVQILKGGMDAQNAVVVDLTFEVTPTKEQEESRPAARLVQIETDLVNLTKFESSPVAQQVVDKHMSVITALENEIIVDVDEATHTSSRRLPPGTELSSQRTRFQQTTVGGVFCQVCF
jgi:2',3'-cyclic-nucleotide 2'-phosphodiesterase (5'-nucleotidase family)